MHVIQALTLLAEASKDEQALTGDFATVMGAFLGHLAIRYKEFPFNIL